MGQNTCNFITEFGVIFIFAKIEGCGQKNIREIKILFDNSFYSREASSHNCHLSKLEYNDNADSINMARVVLVKMNQFHKTHIELSCNIHMKKTDQKFSNLLKLL